MLGLQMASSEVNAGSLKQPMGELCLSGRKVPSVLVGSHQPGVCSAPG